MYIALIIVLIGGGVYLAGRGLQKRRGYLTAAGTTVILFTIAFFWFMSFWGDQLWFDALSYGRRFWVMVLAKAGFAAAGGLLGWFAATALLWTLTPEMKNARLTAKAAAGAVGLIWGYSQWDVFLKYFYGVMPELSDPIIGKSIGFYLFRLPFYDTIYFFILFIAIAALAASASIFMMVPEDEPQRPARSDVRAYSALFVSGGVLLIVLAAGKFLNRYHLLLSMGGVVTGAGWTDVHIRLPAYSVVAVLTAAVGSTLIIPAFRRRLQSRIGRYAKVPSAETLLSLAAAGGTVAAVWFVALALIPALFQWLRVEPNEISFERPYIEYNILYTRQGFNLHRVEERQFPAENQFTAETVAANKDLFENIRIWDHRVLDAVLKQFQEIRLYYEFADVDVDRYRIDGKYRQVMISARELDFSALPTDSKTFVNRRFIYTHGYGVTLTPVQEFTQNGLPRLLVMNIPPVAMYSSLEVERPEIYYGELSNYHVVVNSERAELDYPRGEENVYARYAGSGGILLSNIWRKFLYGWKFDGTRLFLSGYPVRESRIQFRRQITERVQTLAPFLIFDKDPYIVISKGKLYWIVDAYTASDSYPYSEPYLGEAFAASRTGSPQNLDAPPGVSHLRGVNYIRNSVKAVVDAYNGSVDFYVFDPEDPLIQVWIKIFPDLFKNRQQMPGDLFAHVRYPLDFLLVQGLVYAKYHMLDPVVFYNQEDLWVRATEKYYGNVQAVEPYYIMWEPPDTDSLEFVLILPFTPKNKQVLIGWIAGMCDGENYGRFLSYKFPKEKRIIGPQQVETKIDQERFLSGQLSLWDQRGSRVIRGNVLAIPLKDTIFYVEPIYLQSETSAYPELRLVVLMHGDNLSYAENFADALKGLLQGKVPGTAKEKAVAETGLSMENLVRQAGEAFENYLRYLGGKDFTRASEALDTLQESLEQMLRQTGAKGAGAQQQ